MNDLVRDKITESNNGKLPLYGEILAGGMVSIFKMIAFGLRLTNQLNVCKNSFEAPKSILTLNYFSKAGASQVMFTNPLEIVKIRLQVAGEIASTRYFQLLKEFWLTVRVG
jgi:hypothetical protein